MKEVGYNAIVLFRELKWKAKEEKNIGEKIMPSPNGAGNHLLKTKK